MKNKNIPKKGFIGLKENFKDDLLAGFSVSLIALPLCLGIAIASGVPPLAGLITAIIGGIIASRISGTFVTISGPAAGLIVITLGAAESMGGAGAETGFAGYPHALGAILIGGLIMALFGFLKVGKVGDYFPSAAVHGMLAAIGVIIIIKQLFPALGAPSPKGEILEVATEIPHAFSEMNIFAVIISLVALFALIVHPYIKNKIIKMVPAPMWVLIFTIPLAAYFGNGNLAMVDMPDNLFGAEGIRFPSFAKIGESAFWVAVVGVALVSAIESLLSAKAIDSLDPFKRNSNLNRDLIAMGAGSSLAAAIGGLPMISEIVRSSANVNNGAKTQWSNFFHGVFLLIYLLIGVFIIEMIPISALAAMLVFTGFKLAHPKDFKHMAEIGKTEIIVFVITLVSVLATDLIIGIVIGIIVNYLIHFFNGASVLKAHSAVCSTSSNTLMPSGSLNFSNYLSLKKKMDKLSNDGDLKIDCAAITMIDHTVLHHLENYKRNMEMNKQKFEMVNLDHLNPVSNHPLAELRSNVKKLKFKLTKREIMLFSFAEEMGWAYKRNSSDAIKWQKFPSYLGKKVVREHNVLSKDIEGHKCCIADVEIQFEATRGAREIDMTAAYVSMEMGIIPAFTLEKEQLFDKMMGKVGFDDINFEKHPEFSNFYLLKGEDEAGIRAYFNESLIMYLEENKGFHIESNKKALLIYSVGNDLDSDGIEKLEKFTAGFLKLWR